MDWLFKNIGVFVFIAIMVVSLLSKLKKAAGQQPARNVVDGDTSERTRRVQEEIRRKIAARAAPQAESPPPILARDGPLPEPVSPPPARNIFEELAQQMAQARKFAESQTQQRAQAEQRARELAEVQRLAEARRAQQEAQRAVEAAVINRPVDRESAATDRRAKLLAGLRDPQSLKQALVLREILGAPLGLR